MESTYTAFAGQRRIVTGTLEDAALQTKERLDAGETERIAIFQDATGRAVDIDFRGTSDDVRVRLADHPLQPEPKPEPRPRRGPGRPRLGVVSREISLLPRHWEWLAEQSGGASGTLRRLVDEARRKNEGRDRFRRAQEAAHRFMWDMVGDQPGFEEASRAFYAGDYATFRERIAGWPADVREHTARLVEVVAGHDERPTATR